MNGDFKDDTFLARWLNNELSEDELASFKASPEYDDFRRIIAGSENILDASFDQEALLLKIKEKQMSKRVGRIYWFYGAAASILLVVSFTLYNLFFVPQLTTISSEIGEKVDLTLPDGSEVVLGANSKLAFSEEQWHEKRIVNLEGTAYFVVEKGKVFTAQTRTGNVTVLGTQFSVEDQNGFFEVKCFEGSVSVTSDDQVEVLKPMHSVRRLSGNRMTRSEISNSSPEWLKDRSTFTSVPLSHVFNELKNQYRITFEGEYDFDRQIYSGTFPHNDLNLALKVVFSSIPYNYQLKENGVVVILEK